MKNTILNKLENLGKDVTYFVNGDVINVTINDADGYDCVWEIIPRSFDDAMAVHHFVDFLKKNCQSKNDDWWTTYIFEDCKVSITYASYDA